MTSIKTKEERRAYDIERYRMRRLKIIEHLGGLCVKCFATDNLEIDHIDPSLKSFALGTNWTKPIDELYNELKKCQLLCAKCHKEKSDEEKRIETPHGTISGYYHRKCRCIKCKNAYSLYRKNRRLAGLEINK